jgi:hypothetical protein
MLDSTALVREVEHATAFSSNPLDRLTHSSAQPILEAGREAMPTLVALLGEQNWPFAAYSLVIHLDRTTMGSKALSQLAPEDCGRTDVIRQLLLDTYKEPHVKT